MTQDNRIWNPPNSNWRNKLQLLRGNGDDNPGNGIAADVNLVAYNIAKNVSADQVTNYLANKGLYIKDCKLLTTSDEARTYSYKITVRPGDVEKATKDELLWPNGVGVRFFKHFKDSRASGSASIPTSDSTPGYQGNSRRTVLKDDRSAWLMPGFSN